MGNNMRNTISTCLFGIGIIIIAISFITGIVVASTQAGGFHPILALYWWLSGVAGGFLFIGLSEIVHLLQKLVDQAGTNDKQPGEMRLRRAISKSGENAADTDNAAQADNAETKIKDLTILINDVRFRGYFIISKSEVKVMKKSMFQTDDDAMLVTVINKDKLSTEYERNKDYIVFPFAEGASHHKLAFKTYNVFDYERIIRLLQQR
ncbi:hypothetical protein [Paenibacillus glycanilyticus]|uniref:Uncharacterized protein n=1 Tax=Paenibacillus glycanilyticus TaxID=126569 RepID=A0ABQ6GJ11_9BACL|nr:hypothetical protein [Paenibacillus glycanilyticus]GLX70939.1 hypothetical protein MU1_52870 [Paenibacillus glycanilyticus]